MTPTCRTTCPYCGVGCGVLAARRDSGVVEIEGDPAHPANLGQLCSKGAALGDTLDTEGRLQFPQIGAETVEWPQAINHVASRFQDVIAQHGPDSVAFYVSGQLLTEDYYVANKLMKGFIGSANIDTNSRLCMASSVVGHKRAFGGDVVPGAYEDIESADLILLVGSNAAWCHPVLYRRMEAAKERNPALKIVVIDPRRTETCDIADLHLPLKAGSDAILFNGLLSELHRQGKMDHAFVKNHTAGVDAALGAAECNLAEVASRCQLPDTDIRAFFDLFAATERTITFYSQGVNQSSSGTDKVNAIINCHLLTGRIGRLGMGPFSLTGQPNAMGGREVGGLANQLAAHMDFADPDAVQNVQNFWGAPSIADKPGYKAIEMFEALGDGRIKAIWIMGTNPAVSLPDGDRVRKALAACDFVVVSDCVAKTDTTAFADVFLPALAWGEKDGTVTNSERRISRQRAFLPPYSEARADWWIISEVARAMGFTSTFSYQSQAEIFREHAALSGHENNGRRAFDISGLAEMDDAGYESLEPMQWPVTRTRPHGAARLFADGAFYTDDRKARFVAITPRGPVNAVDPEYPLILNTGRVRDHWHTMTRTGISARLSGHVSEPFVALHPADAARAGVTDQSLVSVTSRWGEMAARATVTEDLTPGNVFVPFHWNDQFASQGRVGALINPVVDPHSGQPELKQTPVRIKPREAEWYGVAVTRAPLRLEDCDYWVRAKGKGVWRYQLAGAEAPTDWERWAHEHLGVDDNDVDWLVLSDKSAGRFRYAWLRDGKLQGCLLITSDPKALTPFWLEDLFDGALSRQGRLSLLAGRATGLRETGRIICSCFSVGANQIKGAIEHQSLTSVAEIGAALQAGTNCGSCKPELSDLLRTSHMSPPPSSR
jgi:assimilatory nitrate reductase catalytic subunit